jgi:isopenicillin-N N-acyltransferase-like protein
LLESQLEKAIPQQIHAEGGPYEMGYMYGRKCAEVIRAAIETNYSITQFYTGLSPGQCLQNVQRFLPTLREQVPELCEEMKGIADGSNVSYGDIVVLNFHSRDIVKGCTIFYVGRENTADGRAITGQTIDWTPLLKPFYHVVHLKPEKGPEVVQFTLAGILGLAGRNNRGLNVSTSILLTSEEIQLGVPPYLLLRLAMQQESLDSAVEVLKNKKRASPFNYVFSDNSGRMCNVEAGPDFFFEDQNEGSLFYVHTNHCLQEKIKPIDVYAEATKSSETLTRYSRMRDLLEVSTHQDGKKVAVEDIFPLLKDHQNYPDSICRHPREDAPPEGKMSTVGAIVSRENEDGLWIIWGNPCENQPHFFGFC